MINECPHCKNYQMGEIAAAYNNRGVKADNEHFEVVCSKCEKKFTATADWVLMFNTEKAPGR
jgi:transcription elongation factor Elf1